MKRGMRKDRHPARSDLVLNQKRNAGATLPSHRVLQPLVLGLEPWCMRQKQWHLSVCEHPGLHWLSQLFHFIVVAILKIYFYAADPFILLVSFNAIFKGDS